jgi:hypothetical protein
VFTAFAPEVDPLRMSGAEAYALVAFAVAAVGTFVLGGLIVYPATLGGLSLVGAAGVAAEPIDTGGVVRRALDRAIPACGAFALVFLAVIAVPVVVAALGLLIAVAVGSHAGIPLLAAAGLTFLFPGVYLAVRLSLAVPIVVLEGTGPVEGVRRSWELMAGAFWWALGVYVVVGLVAAAASGLLGVIHFTTRTAGAGEFIVATLRNMLAGIFAVSISGVAVGVIYASREVPPDSSKPVQREAPLQIPVPIPLHAFDHIAPPPKREP